MCEQQTIPGIFLINVTFFVKPFLLIGPWTELELTNDFRGHIIYTNQTYYLFFCWDVHLEDSGIRGHYSTFESKV